MGVAIGLLKIILFVGVLIRGVVIRPSEVLNAVEGSKPMWMELRKVVLAPIRINSLAEINLTSGH